MRIVLSSIEECYSRHQLLDKELVDFASRFTANRKKSFLGGRLLLLESLKTFYKVEKLPTIKLLSHGKPVFFESRYPFFNLSHSSKSICLAIGENECGIDVEYLKARRNLEGLKERILSEGELSYFKRLSHDEELSTFTALWTLRECLIKVSGRGLVDISSIAAEIEKGTFKYYSVPKDTKVDVIRLDALLEHDVAAYLSYSLKLGEPVEFYRYEKGNFIKLPSPHIIKTFSSI